MTNTGPRQTEERLRYHLDSNQPMRERLCLALMPLIGPYTRERPRRPKGGPDGGRDIEAIYEGSTIAWGAVGFRNGGGNDDQARRDASNKFESDLARALEENPALQAFVFFTNVDLTPSIVERLKEKGASSGIPVVDIVDFERLRHALDSPEGLIARLQYLDIPMSATEQISLVNKFGNQLQNAISSRFDRVERTLSAMERFLNLQKPIYRLDIFITLDGPHRSCEFGQEGILLEILGLQHTADPVFLLLWNVPNHKSSNAWLVTGVHMWLDQQRDKVVSLRPSLGLTPSLMTAYCELLLTAGGNRVKLADLSTIALNAYVSDGLYPFVRNLVVDANGYELFKCSIATNAEPLEVDLPDNLPVKNENAKWFQVVFAAQRDLMFAPPTLSGRLLPLEYNPTESR